jgi:hypothetical protein
MEEANAVDASEAEAGGLLWQSQKWRSRLQCRSNIPGGIYSRLGKRDQEILERSTAHVDDSLKDRVSSKERNESNL